MIDSYGDFVISGELHLKPLSPDSERTHQVKEALDSGQS